MPYLNSTAIRHVSYNAQLRRMTITFTSGSSYDYCGVPEQIYLGLISAASAGRYFNDHIDGRYHC
ncbi:KTSC domain-containing protein [Hyphomonas sp. NPDC076900]|uniref:KTSC domain-containing protein n=1 Tax=unclassified Hyphomonas TaxID=2630699 RepID=UPI003D03DB9C